jgi:DUF4097 and DUF4098 domain-containing protein YvlB
MPRLQPHYSTLLCAAVLFAAGSLSVAQGQQPSMTCDDDWKGGRKASHCEIKEVTLPAVKGAISVNGGQSGGVAVKGWEKEEILVRAKIQTGAATDAEARELASQIRLETEGAQIRADGPASGQGSYWAVSFEVFVPRRSDLALQTHNGGISIADVAGQIKFEALNGGVSLKRLGGSVRGQTTNGRVSVELSGERWEGEGLDVKTTNGGVRIAVPENYSARLETGTSNGGLSIGLPLTVQGRIGKQLAVDLGSGGAVVRVTTINGGVSIKRKEV